MEDSKVYRVKTKGEGRAGAVPTARGNTRTVAGATTGAENRIKLCHCKHHFYYSMIMLLRNMSEIKVKL